MISFIVSKEVTSTKGAETESRVNDTLDNLELHKSYTCDENRLKQEKYLLSILAITKCLISSGFNTFMP